VRTLVLLLLLVNLALFGWRQGGFGAVPTGLEPQRLARQISPEAIRLLTPAELEARRGGRSGGDAGASAGLRLACLEFGDFDDATLGRVQGRLAELALGERLRTRRIEAAAWYLVFLPAAATRADAERTALELRSRGIRDLLVMGSNTPMPNAILLGSFRDPELAQRHQTDLARRGVRGIQVMPRAAGAETTRFEINDVDAALARQLAEIQKEFAQSRLGACGS